MSETPDSTDIVAQAFGEIEADVADAGFSTAVSSRLTLRLRVRRVVLSTASLLGLALFVGQLNAGRYLFAELSAPLINIGSQVTPGVDWLALLILAATVTAVTCSTLTTIILAVRDDPPGYSRPGAH